MGEESLEITGQIEGIIGIACITWCIDCDEIGFSCCNAKADSSVISPDTRIGLATLASVFHHGNELFTRVVGKDGCGRSIPWCDETVNGLPTVQNIPKT
jgi:hypothetical protein